MKKLKQQIVAASGIIILATLTVLLISPTARAQITEKIKAGVVSVLVVNTATEPVPVAGTVNVENNADNPLSVRNIGNPSIQPVHFDALFDVPPGKRLIAEYISAEYTSTTPCNILVVSLRFSGGGGAPAIGHTFYPRLIGQDGSGRYVYGLSEVTRVYVDEEKTALIGSTSTCSGLSVSTSRVTGHLINMP